ncbi:hypothetical protein BN1723_000003, partial [Verticillium longisporum]
PAWSLDKLHCLSLRSSSKPQHRTRLCPSALRYTSPNISSLLLQRLAIMSSEERITVHNLADLKNTSDDAIPNYLNSLKFTQSHTLVDIRLALGYTAFAIAGACFAWDYKFGFDATKQYS